MYHGEEPSAPSELAKGLGKMSTKVRIHVDAHTGSSEDSKWRKEEHTRLKKEIASVKDLLKNWDAEKVAAQAKRSLSAELAVKQARLLECEAQMDLDGITYGEEDEPKVKDEKDEKEEE